MDKCHDALTDLVTLIATVIISVTGFRTVYLIAILSVNGHLTYFNPFLNRMTGSTLLFIKLQQI